MRRIVLVLAPVLGLSLSAAAGSAQVARRPFLFKDGRGELAAARARGERDVTVIMAAMPGANAQLAATIRSLGGTIRFRDDNVDYIRARVPVDSVEKLASDPSMHSLDITISGTGRTFTTEEPRGRAAEQPSNSPSGLPAAQDTTKRVWPPTLPDFPLTRRFDPLTDLNAVEFRKAHPTFDGRGVTLALIDLNLDPLLPELQVARTIDGKATRKIVVYETAIDPDDEDDGRWLKMNDTVTAVGGAFTYQGKSYKAPRDGTFRIALLDEAKYDSLSRSGLDKDLNRDGNPPGSSRLFAVIWDESSNDVWVDTNQNQSFADEKRLTDYSVRQEFGVFGKDNPKTAVRETVGFAIQIDKAKKMVAINAGVASHASLIVGAAVASRGTAGRFDGVAPGARLANVAEGGAAYGQTEAVIRALENPLVDAAWLEQSSNITRPYLLRDGRLVPTVIYGRLIAKYKKPIMSPTHNYGIFEGTDDFVLAECAIGIGGHESKANFLANYGFKVEHDDNLLVVGGYGPMGNGAFGPVVISPSNIMSTNRGWEDNAAGYFASVFRLPPGYRIAGGTSTATPVATGAVAMLISAAKQTGVKYDACRIKHALMMSARYVPHLPAYKQGNGVIDVGRAWEVLKAMDAGHEAVTITSRAPVHHAYSNLLAEPNVGVGLFEQDGWNVGDRGDRTVTFTRTSGPSGDMRFAISFTGDSGTYSAPASVTLPLNTPVPVTISVAPKTVGVHSAILTLDNPAVPGHAYRMLTTVVAPDVLDASNHYTVVTKTAVPRPEMKSFFYRVPAGAGALKVELDLQKRGAQLAMMRPDTRTASPQRIVAASGRGGGGGPGPTNLPKETYIVTDPMPGIWEIRLTDTEDTRSFDWEQAEKGKPVPPTPATITVQALGVSTSADDAGGVVLASSNGASGTGPSLSITNRFAEFSGGAVSYPLGASRHTQATIKPHEQQMYEVDVPAGSASLVARVGKASDAGADLDVYVYDCSGKECRAAASSADPVVASGPRDEVVTVQNPAAGKWKIVVDAEAVPTGSTTYEYFDVVFNQSFGIVGANDQPAKRAASAQWNVKTGAWTAALPDGRAPYAALLLEGRGSPAERFNLGLIEVPLGRRIAEK
jgi:hypothetical protein